MPRDAAISPHAPAPFGLARKEDEAEAWLVDTIRALKRQRGLQEADQLEGDRSDVSESESCQPVGALLPEGGSALAGNEAPVPRPLDDMMREARGAQVRDEGLSTIGRTQQRVGAAREGERRAANMTKRCEVVASGRIEPRIFGPPPCRLGPELRPGRGAWRVDRSAQSAPDRLFAGATCQQRRLDEATQGRRLETGEPGAYSEEYERVGLEGT